MLEQIVQKLNSSKSIFRTDLLLIFFPTLLYSCILLPLAFTNHDFPAFLGEDGTYQLLNNWNAFRESLPLTYFTINHLQGLGGNIPFLYNYRLDPGYFVIYHLGEQGIAVAINLWLSSLSISLYLLCKVLKTRLSLILTISICSPIMVFGSFSYTFSFVPLLTPHLIFNIAIATAILSCVIAMYTAKILWPLVCLAISLSIYFLLLTPSFFLLAMPVFIFSLIVFFPNQIFMLKFNQLSGKFRLSILFAVLLSIFLVVAYLAGLFLYTAAFTEKSSLLPNERMLKHVSSLLNIDRFPAVCIYALALISALFGIRSRSNLERKFSVLLGGITAFLFVYSIFWVVSDEARKGIRPLYFEFFTWPIILYIFFTSITSWLRRFPFFLSFENKRLFLSLICAVLLANFAHFAYTPSKYEKYLVSAISVPSNSRLLELRVENSSAFRGRVLVLESESESKQLFNQELFESLGFDYKELSFWQLGIPTIAEYSQFISPRSFSLITRLLSNPGTSNTRNLIKTDFLGENALQLFGISRVVSDKELNSPSLKLIGAFGVKNAPVFLYSTVNTTNTPVSPTVMIPKKTRASAFHYVLSNKFNPGEEFVTISEKYSVGFKQAQDIKFHYDNLGYSLSASSDGISIIALPIEYSSCFTLTNPKAETLEINAGMLGIIFQGNFETRIEYRNGLFVNNTCRLQDYFSFLKS